MNLGYALRYCLGLFQVNLEFHDSTLTETSKGSLLKSELSSNSEKVEYLPLSIDSSAQATLIYIFCLRAENG